MTRDGESESAAVCCVGQFHCRDIICDTGVRLSLGVTLCDCDTEGGDTQYTAHN